jgi:hypothetical protein
VHAVTKCRSRQARAIIAMPPNLRCPHCANLVEDWHFEWCPDGAPPLFYQGKAVTDCPLCHKPVSYQGGTLSVPAVASLPLLQRGAKKAAIWAKNNGTTLEKYIQGVSAGQQYAGYFTPAEIQQADTQAQGTP